MAKPLLLIFAFYFGLCLPAQGADQDNCVGTTETLLVCHSPEVKDFLRQWVRAWGDGDIDTYISLYTTARSPRDSLSRSAWEAHRRARIGPEKRVEINLKLESMGLEDSGIFDVIFTQHYKSETFQDQVRKRLFLLREGDELRIWKEEVL
jgi:hypothetical protein